MARSKKVVSYSNNRLKGSYLSDEDCNILESLIRLDDRKGCVGDLRNIIYNLSYEDVELVKSCKSNDMLDESSFRKGKLEDFQTIGVAYMFYSKSMILGDSVGMGKTVEVCALCNLLQTYYEKKGIDFRVLFLTDKNLLLQAQNEFIKFTGNYYEVLYGTAKYVDKFCSENKEYINYSVIGAHSLLINERFQEYLIQYNRDNGCYPFDLLVIDESGDVLTNSTTKTYNAAMHIRNMFERVILLNATPFEKELRMFYNQLNFVDDSLLPTKSAFSKEYEQLSYTGPYPKFNGKYKNQDKFRQLVGYRYLARTRKSSGATMTNCTADVIITDLSIEQKELLKITSMPYMVYDCPSYFDYSIETNEYTTPKIKALIDLLLKKLNNVSSVLIYTRYKEAQIAIQDNLSLYNIESEILNGDSSQEKREDIINMFKLGDIRVLITNVQKGLNFGNCDYCIFYDYDPNPNKMVQFEGRITRSYNIDNKHVYLILSRGKELTNFKKVVAERAEASDIFAGSDFSCVLSILLDNNKIANLK